MSYRFQSHRYRILVCLILFTIIFAATNQTFLLPVQAQHNQWSPAQTIPEYELETWPPLLIADQNKTVHAFSSQWIDTGNQSIKAIFYNQWTLERGWTEPIDILLSPEKEARLTDVYLDSEGIVHLLFFGGDGDAANIYYSQAFLGEAQNARSWSSPIMIGEKAADPENAVFAVDNYGILNVVYFGEKELPGLYTVTSNETGTNWSSPKLIFFVNNDTPFISMLRIINSETGWLHAIWGVYDKGGQGRGIYYSKSQNAQDWSEPILLAVTPEGLGVQTPTIIDHNNTLFAIFNIPSKITMRRSIDNGETWDKPIEIFSQHVGVNGAISPVIDSNDQLHLLFGQRITGNPDIHGMWHSTWTNKSWTEPEAIVRGPTVVDLNGFNSFDPYEARATVSQGNVILVTWRTDPGLKGNGVWYSYKLLDTPELPLIPLTQPLPATKIFATPTHNAILTDSLTLENPSENTYRILDKSSPSVGYSFGTIIIVGIVPVVILILIISIWNITRKKPF